MRRAKCIYATYVVKYATIDQVCTDIWQVMRSTSRILNSGKYIIFKHTASCYQILSFVCVASVFYNQLVVTVMLTVILDFHHVSTIYQHVLRKVNMYIIPFSTIAF